MSDWGFCSNEAGLCRDIVELEDLEEDVAEGCLFTLKLGRNPNPSGESSHRGIGGKLF